MMRTLATLLCTTLLAASAACAQQIPPPESGPVIVTPQLQDNRLTMRDAVDQSILIDTRDFPLYQNVVPGALQPTITMNPQPTGFDLLYTFTNTTGAPRPLGMLDVGVLTLGRNIEFWDFRGANVPWEADHQNYSVQAWNYPDDLYSPVAVLRNQTHAIGLSLHYPILDWKHDVRVMIATPRGAFLQGEGGQGWNVGFQLSAAPGEPHTFHSSAMLPPGQSRTYVVSVRVTRDPEDWMRTLLPYRNYFRSLYGGVQYTRDARPVAATSIADVSHLSAQNPFGYDHGARPDLHGWAQWTQRFRQNYLSYGRFMLWAPTGLYRNNQHLNYPFQFMSHLYSTPNLSTAFNPQNGLPSLTAAGMNAGYWWGYALRYTPGWDEPTTEMLDLSNPVHREAALREFDAAVAAGARTIGLDTFVHKHMPIWEQLPWIQELQARSPGMRFVGEPSVCDIMHRVMASFHTSWTFEPNPPNVAALTVINNPNYLSDFLLPGHETWAGMTWHLWKQHFNQTPTPQRVRDDVNRMAGFGYVPCIFWAPVTGLNSAAESWLNTVPPGLQIASPPAPPAGGGSGGGTTTPPSGGGSGGSGLGGYIPPMLGGGSGGSSSGSGTTGGGGVVSYTGGSGGASGGGTAAPGGSTAGQAPSGGGSGTVGTYAGGPESGSGSGGSSRGGGGGGGSGGGGGGSSGGGFSIGGGGGSAPSTSGAIVTVTNPGGVRGPSGPFTKAEIELAIARARADMLAFKPVTVTRVPKEAPRSAPAAPATTATAAAGEDKDP